MNSPVLLTMWGPIPSNPPWNGTENFTWSALGPDACAWSIEALKDPVHDADGCPLWASTLNLPVELAIVTDGIG